MPKTSRSKGATENVRVVVRLRPLNQTETDAGDEEVVRIGSDKTTLQVLLPNDEDFQGNSRQTVKKFALDGCFEENTTQPQCFENSGVTALLDSALEGFSATVFAYGQTGSGKTYTMAGKLNDNDWDGTSPAKFDGIIPRSVRYIFQQVEARRDSVKYTIRASFLEIYNELVRDLWNPSSGCLSIREYPPGYWRGFYVEDLYIFECTNIDDMLFMLSEGMRHRAVGSHNLNKDSSRSHSMLTFYLESEEEVDGEPFVKFGKISFVDLAGSERLKETQSGDWGSAGNRQDFQATFRSRARMKGDEMLKETGNINKSLFTLGKVISALGDASKTKEGKGPGFVPYRDSKLTKLLMDSLGGASKALMFACCSPASSYLEETLNTLQYAARARNIQNKPAVQVDPHEELVRDLRKEMRGLREQNALLQDALNKASRVPDCPPSVQAIIEQGLAGVGTIADSGPDSPLSTPSEGERDQLEMRRQPREGRRSTNDERDGAQRPSSREERRGRGGGDRASSSMELGQQDGGGGHWDEPDMNSKPSTRRPTPDDGRRSVNGTGRRGSRRDRVGGGSAEGRDHGMDHREQGDQRLNATADALGERSRDDGGVRTSMDGGFHLPALDDSDLFLRALDGRPRSGSRQRKVRDSRQGTTEDPLLPDSLIDGSSDWKAELNDEARDIYRELGLALYKATSQEEMSAAMKGLQQFERDHRERALAKSNAKGSGGDADPDEAFRKMAMSFYKDERPHQNQKALTELSKLQRKRVGKHGGTLDVVTNNTM